MATMPPDTDKSHDDVADISSDRDLAQLCEVTDHETGAFKRSTFTHIDKHGAAWFGQVLGVRKYDLTLDDFRRSLRRVPDDLIYPKATPSITVVQDGDLDKSYIKRPQLLRLDDEEITKYLPQMLIDEAETLEFLKHYAHPNIVRYYGCTLRNGLVTGIALEVHKVILQYRHESDPRDLDVATCMKGI